MGAIVQGRTLSRPFDAGLADERRRQCRAAVHVATFVQLLQHLPQSPVPRLLCTHVRISVQYSINCWMWGREQPMLPYHRREPTRENPPERTPTGENPHRREPTGENPPERTHWREPPPERTHRRETTGENRRGSGCAGCAVSVFWVCTCVTIAMAGWLHGVCVGACWVVSPQCGFSLSLFCNYRREPTGEPTATRQGGAPPGNPPWKQPSDNYT